MATLPKKWSARDEKLGNQLLDSMKGLAGSFIERATVAAKTLGYSGYTSMPEGVRMFIASIGGKNSHKNKKKGSGKRASAQTSKKKGARAQVAVETVTTRMMSSEEMTRREELIKQYHNDLCQSSSMQHCLHPEDEAEFREIVTSGAAR